MSDSKKLIDSDHESLPVGTSVHSLRDGISTHHNSVHSLRDGISAHHTGNNDLVDTLFFLTGTSLLFTKTCSWQREFCYQTQAGSFS